MLTKLRIYNLAYAELLRRQDVERNQRPESNIKRHMIKRYDAEIDELHELILIEEAKLIEKEKGE